MIKNHQVRIKVLLGLLAVLIVCFSVLSVYPKYDMGLPKVESASLDITHITSDLIRADSHIAVRFRDEQITSAGLHKGLLHNPFNFTPHIEGQAYWQDTKTLVFVPDTPLYEQKNYHGVLDLAKAYGYEIEARELEFHFKTLGQQLISVKGRFELYDSSQSDNVHFIAEIQLAEKIDPDLLQQGLSLKLENKELTFTITTQDGQNFMVQSEALKRYTLQDQNLVLTLAKKPLFLRENFSDSFLLAALQSPLTVLRIEEEKSDEFSRLRIVFSEALDPNLDYQGYINISPNLKFDTVVEDNCLVISGPFKYREKYNVELFQGIADIYGQTLSEATDYFWEVEISDRYPQVEFISSGIFLPSSNHKKIAFRTMNVHRLRLQIKRVTEANLIAFFEDNSYRPQNYSGDDYNRYGFQRFGEIILDEIIEIGSETNKWIQTELNLDQVLGEANALYIVQLEADENQILYFPPGHDYWDVSWYVRQLGTAIKHILVSDIGITAKELPEEIYVFVTNLLTVESIENAIVQLKDKAGRVLDTAYSNATGLAILKNHNEGQGRYIEVRTGEDYTIMNLNSSLLNQSAFDIDGIQKQEGITAFIYAERGVYRPGDEVNLSAIIRNEAKTFPKNHPVRLRVLNPLNKLIYDFTSTDGEDGFYNFKFQTEDKAPTGTWTAYLDVGGRTFSYQLRIEEIVPQRIRVRVDSALDQLNAHMDQIDLVIMSEYLFGQPASGLRSETTVYIEPLEVEFAGYNNFTFGNESLDSKRITDFEHEEALNEAGKLEITYRLPKDFHQTINPAAALRLLVDGRVYESGGRFVSNTKAIPIEHYPSYVGIMKLDGQGVSIGDQVEFTTVHLDLEGQPIANSTLDYNIYASRMYWWWEYGSQENFRRHFKSSKETLLLESGTLTTNLEGMASFKRKFDDYGELLIEIEDPNGGHKAGYFFSSYWWGDGADEVPPEMVNLKMDQAQYLPGETAYVTLNTPSIGKALITVEKEGKIYYQSWQELTGNKLEIPLEVKEEYVPNAYVSVMVYQPYGQNQNDLPLRMYGIMPLKVISQDTEIEFELEGPTTIKPKEEFIIKVQTKDNQPAQFTLAVVDEGLLNITDFQTPNPWDYFFQKQQLLTKNYDNFSDIIDLSYGYNHNILAVGGDGAQMDYREQQQRLDGNAKRFEAVSIFLGPFMTDESGYREVPLQVPDYIGQVRVMVVGANQGKYGSNAKNITVKTPLMVLPTLPRVLAPLDRISIPVTVFALEDNIGTVSLDISVDGPVHLEGPKVITLDFSDQGEEEVNFRLMAEAEIGVANISIKATSESSGYSHTSQVQLAIRPDNPYIYINDEKLVNSGETVEFIIPDQGILDTSHSQLTVSTLRGLNLNHRIKWLMRYPYGCIEQITSAVFPQLYLPELFKFGLTRLDELDARINEAIFSYREFQLGDGGFSYWPNLTEVDLWSTNYVGHFLLEAKKKGYYVPADMLESWTNFQKRGAKENRGNRLTRAYRLYLLSLTNAGDISAMNYMRESEITQMTSPEKSFLAAAYKLMGFDKVSEDILETISVDVADYHEFDITFGSKVRDQAILLDVLTLFDKLATGDKLYNEIATEVSSNKWLSTQTTAYALLALTKYASTTSSSEQDLLASLIFRDMAEELQLSNQVNVLPIPGAPGETLTFKNNSSLPLYVALEWEGIPVRDRLKPVQNKLILKTNYYNEAGREIDISQVEQGDSFYIVYRVDQEKPKQHISELALVQVLPAGWEIENLRLFDGILPDWCDEYNLGQENYVDIRDDRIMWFFDLNDYGNSRDFLVKINAVTVGEFYLPPTLLEAMYNNDYLVIGEGANVKVVNR